MNASRQKTKVQNLGTGPLEHIDNLMHQSMLMNISLMESLILRGSLSLVITGDVRILQTRRNASDRPGSFSNERPQSFMVPDAFYLDFKTQSLSTLRKHAW